MSRLVRNTWLVLRAHDVVAAAVLLVLGQAVQVVGAASQATMPFAAESVRVAVVGGLLLAQAAASAVWSAVPWRLWRASVPGAVVTAGIAGGFAAVAVLSAVALGPLTTAPLLVPTCGLVGLGWLCLAATREVTSAGVLCFLLVLVDLMVPFFDVPSGLVGLSVAGWYAGDGEGTGAGGGVVAAVLLGTGAVAVSLRLPGRRVD